MILKQYHFLVGLPRSGNTLLASLLNQNPEISVTANSLVADVLWYLQCQKEQSLTFKNFPDQRAHADLMGSIFHGYYQSYEANLIIDRSTWGTKNNLKLIEEHCPNKPKFILLVRDVLEVLASFIKWSRNNKPNFLEAELGNVPVEVQCDFLMRPDLQIVQEYAGIHHLYKKTNTILITYKQLTNKPEQTLERIYDFFEKPIFPHKLEGLKQLEINNTRYDDSVFGANLHKVHSKIKPSELKIQDYLPRSVIEKYKDLNFWESQEKSFS